MMFLVLGLVGLVAGHLVRRSLPYLLNMTDKSMPFKWPGVEILGGMSFCLMAYVFPSNPWPWAVFSLILLTIAAADHHTKYIPVLVCLGGGVLGLMNSLLFPQVIVGLLKHQALMAGLGLDGLNIHYQGFILGALGAGMGYFEMSFISRVFKQLVDFEAMGSGDALIMMTAGAFIGPQAVLFAIVPACILGIVMGSVWRMIFGTPHFPFGPALSLGSLIMLVAGDTIIHAIFAFQHYIYNMPAELMLGFTLFLVGLLVYLILRLKKKAELYEQEIEEDYKKTDKKMDP